MAFRSAVEHTVLISRSVRQTKFLHTSIEISAELNKVEKVLQTKRLWKKAAERKAITIR